MAEIDILLQGLIKDDDHDTAVNKLLQLPNIDSYLISMAFVRSNGVERISDNLQRVSDKTQVSIGIRNGRRLVTFSCPIQSTFSEGTGSAKNPKYWKRIGTRF